MSFEKEEQAIADAYNDGEISMQEYNEEIRALNDERRWMAQEAAQEAYDREMEQW